MAHQLGIGPESLRKWVHQAEVDGGRRAGLTTEERARMKELERENRELRRANEYSSPENPVPAGTCISLFALPGLAAG